MQLNPPFSITSGLYPGIKIGEATLELREACTFYAYFADGHEARLGQIECRGRILDCQEHFESTLSLLGVWAGALNWSARHGESENIDLFNREDSQLVDWAIENSDEIGMLAIELEENENLIIE